LPPREAKSEFRRYRQGIQLLAFGVTGIIVAWLLASVGRALFVHPRVMSPDRLFSGRADDYDALLACQGDVEGLFAEVNRELFALQALGASHKDEMAQKWEAFSKEWEARRREIGARCRFSELENRGLGSAYDHLATVYDDLEDVQHAYTVLLDNFIDHHASRVDDIRRTLEASRRALEHERARAAERPHAG
jgi:hypothetical protein